MTDEVRKQHLDRISFTRFSEVIEERGVSGKCEVCGQTDKGWILFSESSEGDMVEMVTLSRDDEMRDLIGPKSGWRLDYMRRNQFFAVICRHCGHTRFHHKPTLLGDYGDAT